MNPYAAAAETPNWTDKLEAWSTFGAAVFAALAVIVAFMVWRHDQRLRREDKLDAQSAQAWLVLTTVDPLGDREQGWLGVRYSITNNSPHTISDLWIRFKFARDDGLEYPDGILELKPSEVKTAVHEFDTPRRWYVNLVSLQTTRTVPPVEIVVTFTDGHGLRWTRKGRDKPARDELVMTKIPLAPLIAEYLRLSHASSKVRSKYRQHRFRLRQALLRKIIERAENPHVPLKLRFRRFATAAWKRLSRTLFTM
ncbi:hypothetical protein [Micromonospora sp. CPCC 205558]|uniref:hypothetical protein n=1 Tax=Micromonospora sp. CPCC 205558 TaxID=3122403 RepID=UPI002FF2078C